MTNELAAGVQGTPEAHNLRPGGSSPLPATTFRV